VTSRVTTGRRRPANRQLVSALVAVTASGTGRVLATLTGLVAAVRPAAKPLHPRGELVRGTITRSGDGPRSGVDWIDTPGESAVVVRTSRAAGLPAPLPDVHGLAVRVSVAADRTADLLFSTTGLGRLSRYLLVPSRHPTTAPMTTLLPYRSPTGPISLAVVPAGARRFTLLWARPSSTWHAFGRLVLEPGPGADPTLSFDATVNTLPGLPNYAWVVRLRAPAYASARRSRR
jgi:hypothetical protein